jgi:hypothetical protein
MHEASGARAAAGSAGSSALSDRVWLSLSAAAGGMVGWAGVGRGAEAIHYMYSYAE